MTGSLQEKNDKYYAVLNLRDAAGKRMQKWISTGYQVRGNKKRAEQFLREKLREYEERSGLVCSETLFSDAVRSWLEEKRPQVDEVTMQGYDGLAKLHLLPYFDDLGAKISDIDRQKLQTYFDEKFKNGRRDGKGGLSPRTLRMHRNLLHQVLNGAVRDGILPSNPCQYVVLPQMKRFESHFYNEEQLNALLSAIKDEPLYPLVKVTAVYGLRRSEVLGLKWDSIDFDAGTITIKHTVVKVETLVEKDKTKTESSRRSFPLVPEIRELLAGQEAKENEDRRLLGKCYKENGYIFKWDDGTPFPPDYVTHRFSKLLKMHGLPHIRFHELRHSCASFLLNSGFTLKDVQEWLGHSDIKMTANLYGHLDTARKRGMADTLSAHLCEGKQTR